jgi:hypothetical protein
MYSGERPTEYAIETDASPLMHLAHKYHIQSLVQLIEQELINRFALKLGYQKIVDWPFVAHGTVFAVTRD